MKIHFALMAVGAFFMASTTAYVTAQTTATASAGTTSTVVAKKSHFENRIDQIRADLAEMSPETTGTIVMVGDSITEGFFGTGTMSKTIGGIPVMNQGISGDQIDHVTSGTGVTTRIDLIKQARPAVVFVMIGVNDFWGGKETPEDVLPQYEKMFSLLKTALPDTPIVLQSVLPTSMKNAYLNDSVDKLNARAKQLAEESGASYLDLHPVMEDENGELKAEFTGDGVHLNAAAYAAWLTVLEEEIARILKNK